MPYYPFECDYCQKKQTVLLPMSNCTNPQPCVCGRMATRRFSRPQLITQPFALMDENKFAFGFDETTRRETMKQDDKDYEAQWARADFKHKGRTMEEIYMSEAPDTFQDGMELPLL